MPIYDLPLGFVPPVAIQAQTQQGLGMSQLCFKTHYI